MVKQHTTNGLSEKNSCSEVMAAKQHLASGPNKILYPEVTMTKHYAATGLSEIFADR